MSTLRTSFNPSTLRPAEQAAIIPLLKEAWKHDALKSSTEAIVYSAPPPENSGSSGRVWWHTNINDKREHITVRYNRRANRVHIYRDGSVNVRPQKPLRMRLKGTVEGAEGEDGGYDSVSELSGEEFDVQQPESAL